jgi:hypothetical protein
MRTLLWRLYYCIMGEPDNMLDNTFMQHRLDGKDPWVEMGIGAEVAGKPVFLMPGDKVEMIGDIVTIRKS